MRPTTLPVAALALISLFLTGCREHNEPVKPIAELSANVIQSNAQSARRAV